MALDLGGLSYSLWSPNSGVVEGDMKLILTPSADALWALTQLPPATPTTFVSNATAFQVLPPCNSGVTVSVGVPSASATATRTPVSPTGTASSSVSAAASVTATRSPSPVSPSGTSSASKSASASLSPAHSPWVDT